VSGICAPAGIGRPNPPGRDHRGLSEVRQEGLVGSCDGDRGSRGRAAAPRPSQGAQIELASFDDVDDLVAPDENVIGAIPRAGLETAGGESEKQEDQSAAVAQGNRTRKYCTGVSR
jgi:hypothetical protein